MTAHWLGWVPPVSRARRYPRSPHWTRPTARATAASATKPRELAAVRWPHLLSQPNHFQMAHRIPEIRSAPTRRAPVGLEQWPSRRLPQRQDPMGRRSLWLNQGVWGRWIPTNWALTMRGTDGSRRPRQLRSPRGCPFPTGCRSLWPDLGARAHPVRRGWAMWVSGPRARLGAGQLPLRPGGQDFVPGSSRRSGRTPITPRSGGTVELDGQPSQQFDRL